MAKTFSFIDDAARQFIEAQPMFFVASAPLDPNGHVNASPKGLDTLRILSPTCVAYLDLTGSGVETIAHVKENGRAVLMFCAFQGPPKIMRVHGRGRVVEAADAEFSALRDHFPPFESARAIVVVEITRVAESCGFGVPLLRYEGERQQHHAWARNRGPEGLKTYRQEENRSSIDGLPGLRD